MGEILFDRNLLKINQKRYQCKFSEHNFIYHEVASIIIENITSLDKNFSDVLEISAKDNLITNSISKTLKIKNKITSSLNSSNFSNVVFDDELIPFQNDSVDLVISNLNMHHINKIPEFLLQVNSVLKKDGLFVASFFGEENLLDLKKATIEAENKVFGGFSSRFIPVISLQTAANLLQKAGFSDPVATLDKVDVNYEEPINALKDIKLMGQGNILNSRSKKFANKKFLDEILNNYAIITNNKGSDIDIKYEIVIIMGWKK